MAELKRRFRRRFKDTAAALNQWLLANRERLAAASDETLQLCCFELYTADFPQDVKEYVQSLGPYLKENAEALPS